MDKRYCLVFCGELAVGKQIETVKNNLCALLKTSPEQVESLFVSGKKTIIKGDLEHGQAIIYKTAFEKTGALCAIVETGSSIWPIDNVNTTGAAAANNPAKLTELRSFYIKLPIKLIVAATPLFLIIIAILLPFNFSQLPKEGAIVLASLFSIVFALTVYLTWKFWKPVLILSNQGIEYSLANLFKPISLAWGQIQGIIIVKQTVQGKVQTKARLALASGSKGTTEVEIGLNALEGGEDALALLRQMIPEKKSKDFSDTLQRFKPVLTDTMKYRDVEIVREGIVTTSKVGKENRVVVTWDSIVSISTEGLVIAGYGSVIVEYIDKGVNSRLLIRASMSEEYHDCIKLLIVNAKNATIDPGVIAILEYPVSSARSDIYAILLVCTGVIFAIAGTIILSFYPPTVASTWLYPLLLLPLSVAPLAWTIKLLSSRFKGNGANPSRKLLGAMLFNIGAVLSVATLFSMSPASFIWLLADTNTLVGRMDVAEAHYLKAEPALSGNENFLFTLGQFYSRKGEWYKASRYYIRSYEKDPTNWMPQPLAQIPNSLCMAGKYDEALQWCDRIIVQYDGKRDIVRAIENKKEEIRSKKRSFNQAVRR
jgi:tetratricopeptide (TPR) repeat protein